MRKEAKHALTVLIISWSIGLFTGLGIMRVIEMNKSELTKDELLEIELYEEMRAYYSRLNERMNKIYEE